MVYPSNLLRRFAYGLLASVLVMLAGLLLFTAGLPNRAHYSGTYSAELGYIAPENDAIAPYFTDETLQREQISLAALRGQPVILNFWATWCGPCLVELPLLQELYEEYREDGLRIIGVNMGEDAAYLREWVATEGLTFDMIVDEYGQLTQLYRLRGNPSTFMIAADGTITRIIYGPADENSLRTVIAAWTGNE